MGVQKRQEQNRQLRPAQSQRSRYEEKVLWPNVTPTCGRIAQGSAEQSRNSCYQLALTGTVTNRKLSAGQGGSRGCSTLFCGSYRDRLCSGVHARRKATAARSVTDRGVHRVGGRPGHSGHHCSKGASIRVAGINPVGRELDLVTRGGGDVIRRSRCGLNPDGPRRVAKIGSATEKKQRSDKQRNEWKRVR